MTFLDLPHNKWRQILPKYLDKQAMHNLNRKVEAAYQTQTVLPEHNSIFKALELTDFDQVRVVILGQDPYPTPGNAMGLAFSVKPNIAVPRSLQNIYTERYHDLGLPPVDSGDLTEWARHGVLLLNTSLTVEANNSDSHKDIGWETFTDGVIEALVADKSRKQPLVFILWGSHAQSKLPMIPKRDDILIIKSSHPSPFSATISFFGSYPFSRANHFLTEHGSDPIDWRS